MTGKPQSTSADYYAAHPRGRFPKKGPIACLRFLNPTPEQLAQRDELEREVRAGITDGIAATAAIGKALYALNTTTRLYAITHNTFEEYCRDVFGMAKKTAWRLIRDWAAADLLAKRLNFAKCEDVKIDNSSVTVTRLLPILTDRHTLRTLSNVDQKYQEQVMDAIVADPEPPTPDSIKAIAKRIVPPKATKAQKQPKPHAATAELPELLHALADAAEVLAELGEGPAWTYPMDQRLAATLQSLRIAYKKLRKQVG